MTAVDSDSEADCDYIYVDSGSDYDSPTLHASTSQKKARKRKTDSPGPGVVKKKAKTANIVENKVDLLTSLPLDILFEMFCHMVPLDLLRLARTTKGFRNVLMHRSAAFVWKAARMNVVNFPECPDDMSEPAYASLAFDTHCHKCLKYTKSKTDFRLRVRYCARCAETRLLHASRLQSNHTGRIILRCIPVQKRRRGKRSCCTAKARNTVRMQLKLLKKEDWLAFAEARELKLLLHYEHADRCETWLESLITNTAGPRQSRQADVIIRLAAEGWQDELAKQPRHIRSGELLSIYDHPLVNKPGPLTDKVWNNIKEELNDYMEELRDWRLDNRHSD